MKENPSLTQKRRRRGFSILEVMIATAVLGIAMAGLVKLHRAAIRGMKTTNDMTIAEDIAEQVADEIAAQDPASLPTNTGVAATCATLGGCKAPGGGIQKTFAADKAAPCTMWLTSAGTARLGDGTMDGSTSGPPATEAAALATGAHYRVDTVVVPHPSGAAKGTVVDVYACWRDEGQIIREVHTRRVVGP